jgi:hypothetical protein
MRGYRTFGVRVLFEHPPSTSRQLLYLICLTCKVVLGLTVESIMTTPAALYSLESETTQIKFPMINSIVHMRPNIATDVVKHFNGRFLLEVLSSTSLSVWLVP